PMRIAFVPSCASSWTACDTVLKNTTFFCINTSIHATAPRHRTATIAYRSRLRLRGGRCTALESAIVLIAQRLPQLPGAPLDPGEVAHERDARDGVSGDHVAPVVAHDAGTTSTGSAEMRSAMACASSRASRPSSRRASCKRSMTRYA